MYKIDDIQTLEKELKIAAGMNFIEYVRELELLKEQTQLFLKDCARLFS